MNARSLAPAVGALAALALVALAVATPPTAAAGWLVAFASVGAVVFGSVALLLIHQLTGGRWGAFAGPALARAAALAPVLALAFVPVLVGAPSLYPWVRAPASAGPGVSALYLNPVFFAGRGLVFVLAMAVLAIVLPRRAIGPLAAGLALVAYCVAMNLLSFDWLLSLDPRYTSSAFGAQIIVSQLAAAIAWAILATDAPAEEARPDRAWSDLAALLLATVLGEAYLILMTFIIHWYGDLPQQADWYLRRSEGGWLWLEGVGVTAGAFGPLVALLFAPLRRTPRALKVVAAATLGGVLAENLWLVAPVTGAATLVAAALAVVALAGLGVGAADFASRRTRVEGSPWGLRRTSCRTRAPTSRREAC